MNDTLTGPQRAILETLSKGDVQGTVRRRRGKDAFFPPKGMNGNCLNALMWLGYVTTSGNAVRTYSLTDAGRAALATSSPAPAAAAGETPS